MGPKRKGKAARSRYMMADFSPEERDQIVDYCEREGTTVSSFLGRVALEEVDRSNREGPTQEQLDITLTIPAEHSAKLQMFAHRQGKSISQYVRELVTPTLEKGKTFFSEDTQSLRYYLSPQQHQLLKKFLKSKNLSARTFVSYLALKELDRRNKK
jgi:hypothetical protein